MQILNIAGYKFITLNELEHLQACFLQKCTALNLRGTMLFSKEGINISLAGLVDNVRAFQAYLHTYAMFADMSFHETYSTTYPFQQLKIKVKKEIITMRQPNVDATVTRAPSLSAQELKQWLDEKRDIVLLDTRNAFEVQYGTFNGAVNLHLNDFSSLPNALANLPRNKPIVMFCTGGIRCEKAALYMLNNGFPEVYQLDGGILGYFAKVGHAHYTGTCFVF